jgi:DNA-binding response OmpR family regulator
MPVPPSPSEVLLVMLDGNPCNPLLHALEASGYTVCPFCALPPALESLRRERACLIILAGLGTAGPCRALRRLSSAPILALLTDGGEPEMLAALEAGADDCQLGSIGQSEALGRVRALLRRASYCRG